MRQRLIIHGPTVIWGLTILVLTSIPTLKPPDLGVSFSDKLAHAGVYSVFAMLLLRSFHHGLKTINRTSLFCFLTGIAFGAIDELHQLFIPGRYAEWVDYGADVLGVGLVVLGYIVWRRIYQPNSEIF